MKNNAFSLQRTIFSQSYSMVQIYNIISFAISINFFFLFYSIDWRAYSSQFKSSSYLLLNISSPAWAATVFTATMLGSLCIVIFPKLRWLRILQWVASLFALVIPVALRSVEDGMLNGPELRYLGWIWINFIFIFLPTQTLSRTQRQHFIYVLWGSVATLLLFYTLAGLSKLTLLITGLLNGPADSFVPFYPSCLMAKTYLLRSVDSLDWVTQFIMNHEYLNFFGFTAAMILEIACLPLAFFPRYHKALGVLLLIFHVFNIVALRMNFFPLYIFVALMLMYSPFIKHDMNKDGL